MWLTLPVTPQGLNPDALAVVRTMLAAKVDLAGVNVMAMDFGAPSAARDMRGAIMSSMTATQKQLGALYGSAGADLDSAHLWHKLGVTVMIGQNDVAGERVSVSDAKAVTTFAAKHDLGRVSMWSLNRDSQCGVMFAVMGTHSNLCSGVSQQPLQFTKTFVQLHGNARATAAAVATPDLLPQATTATADDPARSPYPIWQPTLAYRENYKVVWHQAVYIARWYSEGQTPDAPNVTATVSPWRLIGPVLRTDRAPRIPTLAAGTHPPGLRPRSLRSAIASCTTGSPTARAGTRRVMCPAEPGRAGRCRRGRPSTAYPASPTTADAVPQRRHKVTVLARRRAAFWSRDGESFGTGAGTGSGRLVVALPRVTLLHEDARDTGPGPRIAALFICKAFLVRGVAKDREHHGPLWG